MNRPLMVSRALEATPAIGLIWTENTVIGLQHQNTTTLWTMNQSISLSHTDQVFHKKEDLQQQVLRRGEASYPPVLIAVSCPALSAHEQGRRHCMWSSQLLTAAGEKTLIHIWCSMDLYADDSHHVFAAQILTLLSSV